MLVSQPRPAVAAAPEVAVAVSLLTGASVALAVAAVTASPVAAVKMQAQRLLIQAQQAPAVGSSSEIPRSAQLQLQLQVPHCSVLPPAPVAEAEHGRP